MFEFLKIDNEIIGVDVNDLSLKISKLKKTKKGFDLIFLESFKMPPNIVSDGVIVNRDAFVKFVKSTFLTPRVKKLKTKYLAISLPEAKSFSRIIKMPKMKKEELIKAVRFEAENYIPIPINSVYLDFEKVNEKDYKDHIDVFINAIPRSIVDTYLGSFKLAGLTPCIMEVESQSVCRALLRDGKSSEVLTFLNLGESSANLIVYAMGLPILSTSIQFSSKKLTEIISSEFDIGFSRAEDLKIRYGLQVNKNSKYDIEKATRPYLKDLVLQIKKYLDFYRSHASLEYFDSAVEIKKMFLCGGGANLKNIADFLSKNLNIQVEVGNPLINNIRPVNSDAIQNPLSFTTSIGLAMRNFDNI